MGTSSHLTKPASSAGRNGRRAMAPARRGSSRRSGLDPAHEAGKLAWIEGVIHRVLVGDEPAIVESLERLLHRRHTRGGAGLDERLHLERLALADEVARGGRGVEL